MAVRNIVPATGQIWFVEEPRLGNAEHGHYALVTQIMVPQNMTAINFISTLKSFHDDFRIDETIDGFSTTGLKHSCYLLRHRVYDVTLATLQNGKYKGYVSGELKKAIEEWWGELL